MTSKKYNYVIRITAILDRKAFTINVFSPFLLPYQNSPGGLCPIFLFIVSWSKISLNVFLALKYILLVHFILNRCSPLFENLVPVIIKRWQFNQWLSITSRGRLHQGKFPGWQSCGSAINYRTSFCGSIFCGDNVYLFMI